MHIILSDAQWGFSAGKGTATALPQITSGLRIEMLEGGNVVCKMATLR